jgi:very-short-patch-repair endonuclease
MFGLKFRRQYLLRGFIVDFYCAELRLILEIDGDVHIGEEQSQYDVARAAYVEAQGFTVVRLRNREVTREHLASILGNEGRSFVPPLHVSGEGVRG